MHLDEEDAAVKLALRLAMAYRIGHLAATVAVVSGVAVLVSLRALIIDLSQVHPPVKLGYIEIELLIVAITAAFLLRPRFWEWQKLGGLRTRLAAAGVAALGIAAASAPVFLVVMQAPAYAPQAWVVSNVITIVASVFALSALISPALAGGTALVAYFACAVVFNTVGGAGRFLPLGYYTGQGVLPHAHWLVASFLVLAAVALHFATHGSTAWAQRLSRNEE